MCNPCSNVTKYTSEILFETSYESRIRVVNACKYFEELQEKLKEEKALQKEHRQSKLQHFKISNYLFICFCKISCKNFDTFSKKFVIFNIYNYCTG